MPKLVKFADIYGGPWDDQLFAVRHCKWGWLRYYGSVEHIFDRNQGYAPRLFTEKGDATMAMLIVASRMDEPENHFEIVSMLVMDCNTWDSQ